MKTTRHSLMAKGILVLLSLLILVFVFTYSWYLPPDHPVTANGISVTTNAGIDFDIAIGFRSPVTNGYVISDFYDDGRIDFSGIRVPLTVALTDGENNEYVYNNPVSGTFNLLADFRPVDLTGDGVTLVRPEMTIKNRSIDYLAPTVDHDITPNKQYISFDLIIRSKTDGFVIGLDKESYVVGACEVDDLTTAQWADADLSSYSISKSLIGADDNTYSRLIPGEDETVVRQSTYGSFSEDAVVGAVRMAFTQYNTESVDNVDDFFSLLRSKMLNNNSLYESGLDNTTSKLWIPRSDIYLQDIPLSSENWILHTSADSNWSTAAITDNDSEDGISTNTYAVEASRHRYYDERYINRATYSERYTEILNPLTDLSLAANSDRVIVNGIDSTIDHEGFYYGACRVNLWIEGTDAEARKAINGGAFFFGFDLSAYLG